MEWSLQGLSLNKKFVTMKRIFREYIHTGKSTSTSARLIGYFKLLKKSWVCDHYQQSNLICVCAAHCKLSWRMGVTSSRLALFLRNMAWRSHGESNSDLIDQLKSTKCCDLFCLVSFLTWLLVLFLVHEVLKSKRVEDALRRVDRKHYCRTRAFEDSPQPIGLCRAHNMLMLY